MCKVIAKFTKYFNNNEGGIAIIYLGLLLSLFFVIMVSIVIDQGLYVTKRNLMKKSIDYAVCAAVAEIDAPKSKGLEFEFDKTGNKNTNHIYINEHNALNVYYQILKANININRDQIENNTLCLIVHPEDFAIKYSLYKGNNRIEGEVSNPAELELVINNNLDFTKEKIDSNVVFVNGNIKTNKFEKRPYFMVFIKDLEIGGLFKNRLLTFVSFKAARIIR
jgi:hypothetical protein